MMGSEPDKGSFKVRVTDQDDLWYLYQVIGKGTLVGSHTYRKLENREDQVRPDSQPRVRVFLRIEVEETEFHPFTEALRLKGRIIEGPSDMSGHHTLNIESGSTMEITDPEITEEETSLLEEAVSSSEVPKAIALIVDDESAQLFRLREYGIEPLGTIRTGPGGKMYPSSSKWEGFMEQVVDLVKTNHREGTPLIIAGPGFFKEAVLKKLKEGDHLPSSDVHLLPSSSGGASGLREALIAGEGPDSLIKGLRFARENELIERLMAAIGKGKGAAYGKDEVEKALEMGAVEILLITESTFRTDIGKGMLDLSRKMGAAHAIISLSHDSGKMLEKLGGSGALLRFDIQ